jgi:hypothetical protein
MIAQQAKQQMGAPMVLTEGLKDSSILDVQIILGSRL